MRRAPNNDEDERHRRQCEVELVLQLRVEVVRDGVESAPPERDDAKENIHPPHGYERHAHAIDETSVQTVPCFRVGTRVGRSLHRRWHSYVHRVSPVSPVGSRVGDDARGYVGRGRGGRGGRVAAKPVGVGVEGKDPYVGERH